MFPHISGFHWTPGHLIFLGLFFVVLTVVACTMLVALWRSHRDFRANRAARILWNADFHDLPVKDRVCRHTLTNEFADRICDNAFDCSHCQVHAALVARNPVPPAADPHPFGLSYPGNRLYHRGHTWVEPEPDGTLKIGLDDFARRLLGQPDQVSMPAVGTVLAANTTAWTVRRNGVDVRILSPVDGEVIGTGSPDDDYLLRVKPHSDDLSPLLRGAEIVPWLRRELERVEILLSPTAAGPSLADGGVLVEDLPAACPKANWDAIWSHVFLEP